MPALNAPVLSARVELALRKALLFMIDYPSTVGLPKCMHFLGQSDLASFTFYKQKDKSNKQGQEESLQEDGAKKIAPFSNEAIF
tara:strand:+ start:140 stop:391 length:252 start_codon:yes stop_codon:yes gene_type:complete